MRSTITIKFDGRGIKGFTKELRQLRGELKRIDGQYIFFVEKFRPGGGGIASKPLTVDNQFLRDIIEPPLRMSPSALSPNIASGRLLPDKKRALIGNIQREQAKQSQRSGRQVIRTREQYLAVSGDEFGYFSGRMGNKINKTILAMLRK